MALIRKLEVASSLSLRVDLGDLLHFPLQSRVEPVLDVIVCPPWQEFGDLRPFIAVLPVSRDDLQVLLVGPLILLDIRVQMIMPSLTALLADSSWQGLGYLAPVLRTIPMHLFDELLVFIVAPGTLNHGRIKHLLPSVEALHICPVIEVGSYFLPVLGTKLLDQSS